MLSRNWRGAGGELDIVVSKGGRLRFVEVKSRTRSDDPVGLDCIGPAKRGHLIRAARAWLLAHSEEFEEMAFTVALVEGSSIAWYDDAFDVE